VIIPIGHDQSIRRMPWVTISIIAICTLVQLYSQFGAPSEAELLSKLAAIEAKYAPQPDEERTPEQTEQIEKAKDREAEALVSRLPQVRWGYRTGSGASINLVTSAFVHSGWLHLIGNMLFLWLAGSALENRYGRVRFAVFYLVGAVAATYAYELTARGQAHLLVGASGAISARMAHS
jgi:membrane associated rhomboid family serine protease